jgi:hypothetical protein
MHTRLEGFARRVVVAMAIFAFVGIVSAQALAQDELPTPRTEIFLGYSHYDPNDHSADGVLGHTPGIAKGFESAVTWNFKKWWGITADFSGHYGDHLTVGNMLFGPTVRVPLEPNGRIVPYAHVLAGIQQASPDGFDGETNFAVALGGGFDWRITHFIGWRVIQADWIRSGHNYAPGTEDIFSGARLSTGITFSLGSLTPPTPPSASCSASPASVMEGEPVTVSATGNNFNPKHTLTYDWKSTGGKIEGNGATAKVDTTGMAGGNYTASAHISDAKSKNAMADCSANFAVQERPKNPPQISCSANPSTVQSGSPSTISCTCTSPDNAQLQPLAWQASQGKIAGEGMSATLDTSGLEAGTVSVTTTCTDARGLSSSANTPVNVEKPVVINPSKINECAFPNKVKPARVDNTCKAALDDVALRLQREPDAKAVIVGESDPKEKPANVKAMRAINTKEYLVTEKQIDATRLETRTGGDEGKRVEIWIVPAGSTPFDQAGTTVVTAPEKPAKKGGAKKATTKKPKQ